MTPILMHCGAEAWRKATYHQNGIRFPIQWWVGCGIAAEDHIPPIGLNSQSSDGWGAKEWQRPTHH